MLEDKVLFNKSLTRIKDKETRSAKGELISCETLGKIFRSLFV